MSITTTVFSELTLPSASIRKILPQAGVLPPVKRGDILGEIKKRTQVIVIIDGSFHQNLAVSPSEIMDAIRVGARVYGASSMGALRAAELCEHGMIGYGAIFESIRRAYAYRDDFLGQTFSMQDAGGVRAHSIPFADFEASVRRLVASEELSEDDADVLLGLYGELYYPDRSLPALRHALGRAGREDLKAAADRALLKMPSQKRQDAEGVLRRVKCELAEIAELNGTLRASTAAQAPRSSRRRAA